jgi:D-mannonate dehydratase
LDRHPIHVAWDIDGVIRGVQQVHLRGLDVQVARSKPHKQRFRESLQTWSDVIESLDIELRWCNLRFSHVVAKVPGTI